MRNLSTQEMDGVVGGWNWCTTLKLVTLASCVTGLIVACVVGEVGDIALC